jgi:hypothetical protein
VAVLVRVLRLVALVGQESILPMARMDQVVELAQAHQLALLTHQPQLVQVDYMAEPGVVVRQIVMDRSFQLVEVGQMVS